MSCVKTYATFRLFSKTHTVNEISNAIGLKPTKSNDRNENARIVAERDSTAWMLSTKASVDSVDEHEHIDYLLKILLPAALSLSRLRNEGCLMGFSFCMSIIRCMVFVIQKPLYWGVRSMR